MSEVYLVTGIDREPVAAFSEEEYADEFIDLYSDETFHKEVLFVDAARRYRVPVDMNLYRVRTDKIGNCQVELIQRTFYNISCIDMISFDTNGCMVTHVWANSLTSAKYICKAIMEEVIKDEKWMIDHSRRMGE